MVAVVAPPGPDPMTRTSGVNDPVRAATRVSDPMLCAMPVILSVEVRVEAEDPEGLVELDEPAARLDARSPPGLDLAQALIRRQPMEGPAVRRQRPGVEGQGQHAER